MTYTAFLENVQPINDKNGGKMKTALVILCLVLYGCDEIKSKPSASDQPKLTQRFQLAVDGAGNAWRWDMVTGETWKCWQGTPDMVRPTCYPMYLGQ